MKCPECRFDNPTDSKFCQECGTQLIPVEEISAPTETLEMPKEEFTRGTTLAGRYEIIEELGKGGMGRVYKALDKEINEEVAIKILKPEIAEDKQIIDRFRNELKYARKISHKNVCRMYHIAKEEKTLYIMMEYVQGEDLKDLMRKKGVIPEKKAVSIAKQVGEGLAEAHRLGVVHRDLKPSNIMIDKEGDAKIMDFGIARSVEAPGVTQTGVMIGTPDYISPEQAEGEEADQRSDIYSLGVILYEMVTGSAPFKGDTAFSVALKHKTEIPKDPKKLSPELSKDLSHLILVCMEKDRKRRYQTAEALLADLGNIEEGFPLGTKIRPRRKTFASALIRKKLLFPALMVITLVIAAVIIWRLFPRKTITTIPSDKPSLAVMYFKNNTAAECSRIWWRKTCNTSNPGDDLVLIRSSAKSSASIRVRLIKVLREEKNLWEETYDRVMTDMLVMYSDVARVIAREIKVKLSPQEETRLASSRQVNSEAYEALLNGKFYVSLGTPEGFEKGLSYLHQAVEKDPTDPRAYAGLADAYISIAHSSKPTPDALPRAQAAVRRALRLDDTLADGHAALALIKTYHEWDWAGAEKAFQRALELNPNLAMTHYHYAWYLHLFGRLDETIAEHKRAKELDPLNPLHSAWLAGLYLRGGHYEEALVEARKSLELDPDFPISLAQLGSIYADMGMYEEAIEAHKKLATIEPSRRFSLGWTYARAGRKDEALKIVAELEKEEATPFRAYGLARLYAALGEKDEAFRWLAYEPHSIFLPWIRTNPVFKPMRDDPRFKELLRMMNLPEPE